MATVHPLRRPVALALVAALLAASVLATGCTTARRRDSPRNMLGNLRFRDAQTAELFRDVYRSGNLYQEFRPVLVVDAIFEDVRYRSRYLGMLREQYLVTGPALRDLEREQQREFETEAVFVMLLYGGSNEPVRLQGEHPDWRLFLGDDDGRLVQPSRIEEVESGGTVHRYLRKYFIGVDRWSQVFRVHFPKLDKRVAGLQVGPEPFRMLVTGVEGRVTLTWDDPALFFAGEETVRARP